MQIIASIYLKEKLITAQIDSIVRRMIDSHFTPAVKAPQRNG